MLELLSAISYVDPPSLLALLVLVGAAGMYPIGIMLGSSCSPCCQQGTPCLLSSSTPAFPSVLAQYACDNDSPKFTTTLGVAGASSTGISDYFNSERTRDGSSLAKSLLCENICSLSNINPTYSFAGAVPRVSVSLSFGGNAVEIKHYFSKFTSTSSLGENHCYRHTTICRAAGTYELSHVGNGVFRYSTTSAFGSDWFTVTASLHRCNDVLMWLLSVAFVSRTVQNKCSLSRTASPDASVCNSTSMPGGLSGKTLRCCVGHVLHYATACIRTTSICADSLNCSVTPLPSPLTLDATDISALSVSGALSVTQRVLTSGNDVTFGNPYSRPGFLLPETESPAPGSVYAGKNAGCFCLDSVHTFKNVMPLSTSYGGPFAINVS